MMRSIIPVRKRRRRQWSKLPSADMKVLRMVQILTVVAAAKKKEQVQEPALVLALNRFNEGCP
jgi:hypothetical protein